MRSVPTPLFRVALLAALATGGCGKGSSFGEPQERPGEPAEHLLLVTFENLRADHVSGFGYGPPTTYGVPEDGNRIARPELDFDALLDLGVGFVRAYSPSPRTHPALAGLHYGVSPPGVRVFGSEDTPRALHPSLAELLRGRGMATRAFISESGEGDLSAFSAGFETFESCAGDMATATAAWDSLTQARTEEPERPLFLWLHFSEIAPPLDPAPVVSVVSTRDFRNWFDVDREPEADDPGAPGSIGSREYLAALTRGEIEPTEAERRRLISLYDGEISRAVQVLRVFLERYAYAQAVVEDGKTQWVMGDRPGQDWQDTLLVVCGLQGLMLGEECGAWGTTEYLSDATLNVPLFFHHPNSFTGRRLFDDVVELQDVSPTLLELFDVRVPKTVEGRSLLALTDTYSPREFEARPAFAHLGRSMFSLRTPYWRMTCELPQGQVEPLNRSACDDLPALRLYEGAAPLLQERRRPDAHPDVERRLGQWLGGRVERELGLDVSELLGVDSER